MKHQKFPKIEESYLFNLNSSLSFLLFFYLLHVGLFISCYMHFLSFFSFTFILRASLIRFTFGTRHLYYTSYHTIYLQPFFTKWKKPLSIHLYLKQNLPRTDNEKPLFSTKNPRNRNPSINNFGGRSVNF